MRERKIRLGVVPTKRSFLSMDEAKRQKDAFMARIRELHEEHVDFITIDDLTENGILYQTGPVPAVVAKMEDARIDALFIPFCDFGEEEPVARVAGALRVPTLVWGNRDERCNTFESRGRDTQCGMFAATKVMQRFGVTYSYIWNCETGSEDFARGFDRFIRTVSVLVSLKGLRVAKIGDRPGPFFSVMSSDAGLLSRFGIQVIPISPYDCAEGAKKLVAARDEEMLTATEDLLSRFDPGVMSRESVETAAALRIATQRLMEERNCQAGAFECWSGISKFLGTCPCVVLGEMADLGLPLSCETDVNGAITMRMLAAAKLYEEPSFLADLTIRSPEDDNTELLWHCGPFPYSLKDPDCQARLVAGQESFRLKQGKLTIARFDELDGKYSLFCGEGETTTGPETNGTYVYLKVDNWKRWEEKLMFGPYIHHVGGVYGEFLPVLREAARYLGVTFDNAHEQGIYSL